MSTTTAEPPTAREHLKAAEAEVAPEILAALREAAKTIKTAWGTCSNCKHRVQVEIQDAQAAIAASKAFMDYTSGKPSTTEADSNSGVTIVRQLAYDTDLDAAKRNGSASAALEGRAGGIAHAPAGHGDGQLPLSQAPDPEL